MRKNNLTIEVLVRGRPVREFYHHDGQVYIEGRKSSAFEIRIRNDNSHRVLALPSVDGLSVMDGEIANSESTGYIINGFSSLTIPGWRLDNDQVAEFFFQGQKGQGYAAQSGKAGNEGVIGVMFFEEKVVNFWTNYYYVKPEPWKPEPWKIDPYPWKGPYWSNATGVTYTSSRGSSAGASSNKMSLTNDAGKVQTQCNVNVANVCDSAPVESAEEDHISVGFGESVGHKVYKSSFNRGAHMETFIIYYDTRKGLEQRGIEVVKPAPKPTPNPFPGDRGCTPPPGWKS